MTTYTDTYKIDKLIDSIDRYIDTARQSNSTVIIDGNLERALDLLEDAKEVAKTDMQISAVSNRYIDLRIEFRRLLRLIDFNNS